MSNVNFSVPAKNQKALERRSIRSLRVLGHTKQLHAAAIVVQLRREERRLQREFWGNPVTVTGEDGIPVVGPALAIFDRLLKCRDRILEICHWPKPPTARMGQSLADAMTPKASRAELAIEATDVPMDSPAPPSANGSP